MPLISIVVPTITGREHWLERFKVAYAAHTEDYELIVVPNDGQPVGVGWQAGAEKATGKYLHLTNDDCEPLPGWWQAAVEVADRGETPAGPVLNSDGTVDSLGEWGERTERPDGTPTVLTRIPFCSMEQWELIGPMLPIHYFSDDWFSWRAIQAGVQPVICNQYRFYHYWAQEGRVDARMAADGGAYHYAISQS